MNFKNSFKVIFINASNIIRRLICVVLNIIEIVLIFVPIKKVSVAPLINTLEKAIKKCDCEDCFCG